MRCPTAHLVVEYRLNAMAHSRSRVLIHVVWSTWRRTPWIDRSLEVAIRDAVAAQAERTRCPLLAFGAFVDHVHVALDLHRTQSLAVLLRALKGASGHVAAHERPEIAFRWQEGYGAFSISERDPEEALAYVRAQRERHAANAVLAGWEPDEFDAGEDG